MFRGYRPDGYHELTAPAFVVDVNQAIKIQKAYSLLPERNRWAIAWAYVYPFIHPGKIQRGLGVTFRELQKLVADGRSMLANTARVSTIRENLTQPVC